MVETSQAGRLWPHLYEPLRGLGNRLSEFLSPASDASSDDNIYRISIELPGVSEEDIDLRVTSDSLIVSGEKTETRENKGETWYFQSGSTALFADHFDFLPLLTVKRLKHIFRSGCLK